MKVKMLEKEKARNKWLRDLNDTVDRMSPKLKFVIVVAVTGIVLYFRYR